MPLKTTGPLFAAIRTIAGPLSQADVDLVNAALVECDADPAAPRAMKDPAAFFAGLRAVTGSLDQEQVDTVNDLLVRASGWSAPFLAYGLATAWHEARLKPIEEYGKGAGKAYGKVDQTGKAPYGRGLVQLTWRDNYVKADGKLSLGGRLSSNYDLALDPDIAAQILVRGMEEGWFTGKKLADYITVGTQAEFVQCRRVINGTDRAELIAGYAVKILAAINAGRWA